MSLDSEFKKFYHSPEAKKPVFDVPENWREIQHENALRNGDLYEEENPSGELPNSYYEPDYYEAHEVEEERSFVSLRKHSSEEESHERPPLDLRALRKYLAENPEN